MISMVPRLPLSMASNQSTHALLCLSRQRPAKMVVDSPGCRDGVARNFVVLYIADAVIGESIAFLQKFIHGFGPVVDCLPAGRERIDGIAKGAAKDGYQTRHGSHRIDWRPVRVHK